MLLKFLTKNFDFEFCPPIDVEKICDILKIKIVETIDMELLDKIGSISFANNRPKIWLNPAENNYENRRRFTIAHEIGHYILHLDKNEGSNKIVDSKNSLSRSETYWDSKEYEANNFAAQLLMPHELIKKHGKKIIETYKGENNVDKVPVNFFIEQMSNLFKVSKQAMKYRLVNLGFIKGRL